MTRQLHKRLSQTLPRHGDRSRLVVALLEAWLDQRIDVPVFLKSQSVALRNTYTAALGALDARRDVTVPAAVPVTAVTTVDTAADEFGSPDTSRQRS